MAYYLYHGIWHCMVKTFRGRFVLLVACVAGVCMMFGYFWFLPLKLVVESTSGKGIVLPTKHGDEFSLRFLHSVHKTPVLENFVIEKSGSIVLTSTEFSSYGVGMPFLPEEGTLIKKNDNFVLTGVNRNFRRIPLRSWPEAQLSLIQRGYEYPLFNLFDDGALLEIRIDHDWLWFISCLAQEDVCHIKGDDKDGTGRR